MLTAYNCARCSIYISTQITRHPIKLELKKEKCDLLKTAKMERTVFAYKPFKYT